MHFLYYLFTDCSSYCTVCIHDLSANVISSVKMKLRIHASFVIFLYPIEHSIILDVSSIHISNFHRIQLWLLLQPSVHFKILRRNSELVCHMNMITFFFFWFSKISSFIMLFLNNTSWQHFMIDICFKIFFLVLFHPLDKNRKVFFCLISVSVCAFPVSPSLSLEYMNKRKPRNPTLYCALGPKIYNNLPSSAYF